jgi:23S rRNA-/tRNA-specific pseudouridylate synthase
VAGASQLAATGLQFVYRDKKIVIVSKPGGVPCQRASSREQREQASLAYKAAERAQRQERKAAARQRKQATTGQPDMVPASIEQEGSGNSDGGIEVQLGPDSAPAASVDSAFPVDEAVLYSLSLDEGARAPFLHMYHRIDAVSSGCVMFVRSRSLIPHIDEAWDNGTIERRYVAVIQGIPEWKKKVIRSAIEKAPSKSGVAWKFHVSPTGLPARTDVTVLGTGTLPGSGAPFAVVEALLGTGRTHQVRVHLSHLGHPIVGDVLYGASTATYPLELVHDDKSGAELHQDEETGYQHRVLLHSHEIRFTQHVRAVQVEAIAPLPADMRSYVRRVDSEHAATTAHLLSDKNYRTSLGTSKTHSLRENRL